MKKFKSKAAGQTSNPKTIPVEYDGNIVARNYWFKIGLSRPEIAALKKIRERFYHKPESKNLAATIRALLLTALAHYERIEPHRYNDVRYARREGFISTEMYQEELIIKRFELIHSAGDQWS
jgi:hypothetical protein